MINNINSVNFKGIVYGGLRDFSESQIKVADDIKTKLGKTAEKNDFLIKALADDIVELSEVYNVKKVGTGINKEIQYSKGVYIGKYDEKHPFELEDYNYAIKEKAKDFSFKDILNKFKRGAKEISSDIEKEKQEVEKQLIKEN